MAKSLLPVVVCVVVSFSAAARAARARQRPPRNLPTGPVGLTLTAPTGLKSTTSPQECAQHAPPLFGGMICDAAIRASNLVLIWNWSGREQIDGYRIYRVDGGRHSLADTQSSGKDWTIRGLSQPSDGFNGKCYAVVAYSGRQESDLSNPVCGSMGSVVQTMTLNPQHMRSSQNWHNGNTGAIGGSDNRGGKTLTQLSVGYYYATNTAPGGDWFDNTVNRGGLFFDLGSLAGRKIYSARLHLQVDTTHVGSGFTHMADPPTDHTTSCAAKIGTGMSYWWNYTDWIDGSVVLSPGTYVGPDVAMDATSIVRSWVEYGQPNYGFVLFGEEENLNAFTEKACQTAYTGQISLEVQYY